MAEENAKNNNKDANSSTQANENRPKKRYRSDDSIANMLGDKLDNFTAVFKADVCEPPPKPASPEEIWAALGEVPDLEDDDQLAIYDVLVADDHKLVLDGIASKNEEKVGSQANQDMMASLSSSLVMY